MSYYDYCVQHERTNRRRLIAVLVMALLIGVLVAVAQTNSIRLAWTCQPAPPGAQWETGLIGSTNLRDWYVLARLPYARSNYLVLTNRPSAEFYRAFNGIKGL